MDSLFGSNIHPSESLTTEDRIQVSSSIPTQTLDVTELRESDLNVRFNSYPMDTTTVMHAGYDDVFDPHIVDTTESFQLAYDGYQAFEPSFYWEPEATGGDPQRAMTQVSAV